MNIKKSARKALGGVLTIGATLSIGFLSFAGMFVLSTSLWWCGAAFILAAAYEGQVNSEGISLALRRMFDKNHLKLGIIRKHLKNLLELEQSNNCFLKDYKAQKEYLEKLQEVEHPTKEQIKEKAQASKRLRMMELFYLKQVESPENNNPTLLEKAAKDLLAKDKKKLLDKMKRKLWLIRFSWLFALGGGISAGLATLSAIKIGFATFTILSAIPGGVIVALAVFAAVGYSLLLYQSISDMVQEYGGKWKNYFERGEKESTLAYGLRCVGAVLAVALAIFGTIATAGSWWYAAKHGASLLNIGDRAASMIRSVSVSVMALPSFLFGVTNSIISVDGIMQSNYTQKVKNVADEVKDVWHKENILQFINPFRCVEKIITYTAKTLLFLGHTVSIGLMSDHFAAVPVSVSVAANAMGEVLTDLPYLPDEKKAHEHQSILLGALFLPITLTVGILKLLAVVWDAPFSGGFTQSWKKMFSSHTDNKQVAPKKPELSAEWCKQEVLEVCDQTIQRLQNTSIQKVKAANQIKQLVSNPDSSITQLKTAAKPLAANRHSFWKQEKPQSKKDMDSALGAYIASRNQRRVGA